jgi:hypothetical protein
MRTMVFFAVMAVGGCNFSGADEQTFTTTYGPEFCDHTSSCNPSLACTPAIADMSACAYDPVAASECLSGDWSCNTAYRGYEFAEPPSACDRVWDCSVARR